MKVFRKELYYKATGKTEESVKANKITWPMECDGKEVVKSAFRYDILGTPYGADETWLEEVCDITREEDREQMKDWKIGTEHVIRKNGKDVRVVVSHFEIGENLCSECAANEACYGRVPCTSNERTVGGEVYLKEVKEHKPLVLKLFFSPERNMTFTEHDINPEVGFVTGKYYRYKGTASKIKINTVLDCLVHKCMSVTKHDRPSRDCKAVNVQEYVFTFDNSAKVIVASAHHVPTFAHITKLFVEMRPFIVMQEPDIITFDELSTFKDGSVTGEFTSDLKKQLFGDWGSLFDAVTDDKNARRIAKTLSFWDRYGGYSFGGTHKDIMPVLDMKVLEARISAFRSMQDKDKEKPKMKVDENFTFKKKYMYGTTLHEPKVIKTHKAYANDGACEACGLIISKGSFVLTANETDCNKVTKKTHRLCASCTAKYIKAKSDTDEKQSYIEGFKEFVKTNDIKVGTRIRITKDFGKDEDAGTYGHNGAEGKCGTVYYVGNKYINVRMDGEKGWWSVPYYAMEVIKEELTYKPITGFEAGKWYVCHLKERPNTWNMNGKMDGLLDGKPHKCIFGKGLYADFEDIPLHGEFLGERGWRFGNQLQFFEEVPAPVVSYAEIQAQWVKENNVRFGTKVRFTRGFGECEDGSLCCSHKDAKGNEGVVHEIERKCVWIKVGDVAGGGIWACPFTALEVLPEEPWFKIGDKVRITIKSSEAYNKIGTVTNLYMHKDGTQTVYMHFEEFWDTKAFNADSKEKIGELYAPTYKELQDAWIAKHNLKEGDKVIILRTAKDREKGWPNSWCDTMNNKVGQMYIYNWAMDNGIGLSCGYSWPYFVLGVVKE